MLSEAIVSEKRIRRRTPVRWKQIRKEMRELSDLIGIELNSLTYSWKEGTFKKEI